MMDNAQQTNLKFKEIELSNFDVVETGRELGRGAYGIVQEVNVKGLRYGGLC